MRVEFIEAHPDGSKVYRVEISDHSHLEQPICIDLIIRNGEVEYHGEPGLFTWTPEDSADYALEH